MIGPHPAALWNVLCGNGLLRLWEQQGHSASATCRCEYFLLCLLFTTVFQGRQVYLAGSDADVKSQGCITVAGITWLLIHVC